MLKMWWDVERCLIEKKTGGIYALAWAITETGFGYISTGIIEQYDPAGFLKIGNLTYFNPQKSILGAMELTVRATRNGDHTDLYLCQDGYQDHGDWLWYYEAVSQAWPIVVKRLTDYVEKL